MKEGIRKMLLLLQNVLYCLMYASLIKCAVRNDGRKREIEWAKAERDDYLARKEAE